MHLIRVEDLLPRRERALDFRPVAAWLKDKRVAVTGAGFIGSELARQLSGFVESLTLVENNEYNLYRAGLSVPSATQVFADVRDIGRMVRVLRGIDVVFHAAAMKHVPICEENHDEAVYTNIEGTRNVLRAAEHAQIVLVSTDKAVAPTTWMGKTKQAAERLCRESGRAAIVRFGNVIGSSGSVVPLFQEQIARGGPVTITHRDMTRYFMTVGEAAELILQAGAQGTGVYVLDMGQPVSILTLAGEMIRLSGRRDVEIIETRIRTGEKLHEVLSTEPLVATGVDGLMRVVERVEEMA